MAADMTRNDLAQLRARLNDCLERLRVVDESESHQWAEANAAWLVARENLRAALYDHADALLAAAERDLDRREGLVFGPWIGTTERARAAVASDGALYWITATKRGFVLSMPDEYGNPDGVRRMLATESEAIAAARAHDRARRGVKP